MLWERRRPNSFRVVCPILAIDILTSTYYNESLANGELIHKLQNLSSCRNLAEAREFSLQVDIICRQLGTLWLGTEVDSFIVSSMLELNFLSFNGKRKKATIADPWTTTRFRTLLNEYVFDKENLNKMRNLELKGSKSHRSKAKTKENWSIHLALILRWVPPMRNVMNIVLIRSQRNQGRMKRRSSAPLMS